MLISVIQYAQVKSIMFQFTDRPLLQLFKRLIGNDTKQNTVLTNAQIIEILKKEFLMDISYIHDLEIEMYLNLMKKFLKEWPQWDDFDQKIQSLKMENKEDKAKEKMQLEENYGHLKEYLKMMLGTAKPMIKNVLDDIKDAANKETETPNDKVVLEVSCTRSQLNKLFFRRPHPEYNNTIFNVHSIPMKININVPHTFKSILNWPNTKVIVNLGSVGFRREVTAVTSRRLVNKKLMNWTKDVETLNMNVQMRQATTPIDYSLDQFFRVLENSHSIFPVPLLQMAMTIFDVIKSDFTCSLGARVSHQYRKMLNKYPYVRYLYSEIDQDQSKYSLHEYDLQLEEVIVPQMRFHVTKFETAPLKFGPMWLIVQCIECDAMFSDWNVQEHFEECHQGEPEWQCMNCRRTFSVLQITDQGWWHNCDI
jgi:hypothetical protein